MTDEQIKAELEFIQYAARIGDHEVAHRYEGCRTRTTKPFAVLSKEVRVMERTITIGSGVSQFTLKPGDKAVIQRSLIGHDLAKSSCRRVVTISRILGSETAPYAETIDENGKVKKFNTNGYERGVGFHDQDERLLPFISDDHELKMEQVRAQWNNRHSVRSRLECVLGRLHRSAGAFYDHPELVDELEAILNKIEGAKQ